jgi:hypothetical protein
LTLSTKREKKGEHDIGHNADVGRHELVVRSGLDWRRRGGGKKRQTQKEKIGAENKTKAETTPNQPQECQQGRKSVKETGLHFPKKENKERGRGWRRRKVGGKRKVGRCLRNDAFVTVFCVTLAVFLLDRSFGRRRQGVSEVAVSEVLPFI